MRKTAITFSASASSSLGQRPFARLPHQSLHDSSHFFLNAKNLIPVRFLPCGHLTHGRRDWLSLSIQSAVAQGRHRAPPAGLCPPLWFVASVSKHPYQGLLRLKSRLRGHRRYFLVRLARK